MTDSLWESGWDPPPSLNKIKNTMKKPLILVCALLALLATHVRAEVSRSFGKEAKALAEADISVLIENKVQEGEGYYISRTALKLTGFEVTFSISVMGRVLSARYLEKGTSDDMDIIFEELNIARYRVSDSNYISGLIEKNSKTKRKIVAKNPDTGQNVLEVTLAGTGAINVLFFRN